MRKCFVCKKKIGITREKICATCFDFFKEKYGNGFRQHLERIREYLDGELEEVLQWHKNHTKELNKED